MGDSDRRNTNMAIDFTVTDTAGKPWTLSDHLDAAVVMTFHRGDFWTYCHGQLAVLANRHDEFLERGARLFPISADTPPMNSAVVDKLALPFPILSDPDRSEAIEPLGFADEKDPRDIAGCGTVILAPTGEVVFSGRGRDYADRHNEDELLEEVGKLDLPPTSQSPPDLGEIEAGPKAMPYEGIGHYFRGAKFATLAIRQRHRDLGREFTDDTKRYIQMVERYLEALPGVEERKA